MRTIIMLAGLIVVAAPVGCTAQSFCNKRAECLREIEGRTLEADSTEVCIVEFDTALAVLRANTEDECHRLADAIEGLASCRAGLKCDDFAEADHGRECDDQQEALDDATRDVDGFECTPQES